MVSVPGNEMPELPEIETLKNGLATSFPHATIKDFTFYRKDLREPLPCNDIVKHFVNQEIIEFARRSKYLIIKTKNGGLLLHLGMSGKLLHFHHKNPSINHTHFVITITAEGREEYLHYIDPRRFGRLSYYLGSDPLTHSYFKHLGPEPLLTKNLADHLWQKSRNKSVCVKSYIMDQTIVVGVGNIYACESLFKAGMLPTKAASQFSKESYKVLAKEIKSTLRKAIKSGGTTLKDFAKPDGSQGYFKVQLNVYGKANQECPKCKSTINSLRISGRSTFFCPICQK